MAHLKETGVKKTIIDKKTWYNIKCSVLLLINKQEFLTLEHLLLAVKLSGYVINWLIKQPAILSTIVFGILRILIKMQKY